MFNIKKIELNKKNLEDILLNKSFKDLRLRDWKLIIEWLWEEIYELEWYTQEIFFHIINELTKLTKYKSLKKQDWKLKFFSFHLPIELKNWKIFFQWFRWVLKNSVNWREITLRKLVWPNNLNNIIRDENFLDLILESFTSRKSFVISWRPWAGKSTILISTLEFFNENTYNSILFKYLIDYILEILYWWIKTKNSKEINNIVEKKLNNDKELINKKLKNIFNQIEKYLFYLSSIKKLLELEWFYKEILNILNWNNQYIQIDNIENWEIIELLKLILENNKKDILEYLDDSIKETLIIWKLKKFNKIWLKNVNTLESPVEYIYKDNYLRFYQHDVDNHFNWN